MRRPALTLALLTSACPADKGSDTGLNLSSHDEEVLATIDCAQYSRNVCGHVERLCSEEMAASWADETSDKHSDRQAWQAYCLVTVQEWCVDQVTDDFTSRDFVIVYACGYGYDEVGRSDYFTALTCADVASGDDFEITYDYIAACPCLESGEYHLDDLTQTYTCGNKNPG